MNDLKRAHARWAIAVAVLVLAFLAQGSLLAFADPPRSDTLQLDDTTPVTTICSFPLVFHEEGAVRTTVFFDRDGQLVRVSTNWQGVQSSYTNPANGRSLSYRTAGHDSFTVSRDGTFTVATQGVRGILTVPGSGAITGEAGHITIRLGTDGTMEIQRSGFLREGDFGVACAYLQGTP